MIAVSGFVIGAGTIAFWVPFHAAMLRLVPGRAATVTAVVGTIEMTGLAVAPLIGAVSDTWGLRAGLVVYALLPIACWRGLRWHRRTSMPEPAPATEADANTPSGRQARSALAMWVIWISSVPA